MKKRSIISLNILLLFFGSACFAQVSDTGTLMTVGKRPVSLQEFKSMYYKNLSPDSVKSQKALDNYLKLFIEFRLKVNAALDMGLDTTESFKQEISEYRQKLADPYMQDPNVEKQLVQQAYDRMQTDVRASHILIKVGPEASPQDTLTAYKKIMSLREKIIKKQISFENAAAENSEDTYSKVKGGDLGYFTALEMVYPFENAAYTTKIGEISMPVRTQYGYHIIKVTDKKADVGQVMVAHIMLRTPSHMTPQDSTKYKNKIDSIYRLIVGGANFADMARKFSQDPSSAKAGGTLQWFGIGRMPPTFEATAFALKNIGDISEPIRTNFGWHIIKLLGRKGVPPLDSIKESITARMQRDNRKQEATDALVKEIKKQYNFKEFPEAKVAFYKVVDSSFYTNKWNIDKAKNLTAPIFSLGTTSISQQDFAKFISRNQMTGIDKGGKYAVDMLYPRFVKEQCLKYKNERLEAEYPAFAQMLSEYRDGILLFDVTDKMVWSKAIKDTAGLKKFYEEHESNYMWPERAEASIYTCSNDKIAKEVKKLIKSGKTDKEIETEINAKDPKAVSIQSSKFEKKDNALIDANWKTGISEDQNTDGKITFVYVKKIMATQPKALDEARGIITTDYQNYLMTEWIARLKAKYPVQINQQELNQVMAR